jgi:hypothetical protein
MGHDRAAVGQLDFSIPFNVDRPFLFSQHCSARGNAPSRGPFLSVVALRLRNLCRLTKPA